MDRAKRLRIMGKELSYSTTNLFILFDMSLSIHLYILFHLNLSESIYLSIYLSTANFLFAALSSSAPLHRHPWSSASMGNHGSPYYRRSFRGGSGLEKCLLPPLIDRNSDDSVDLFLTPRDLGLRGGR